MKKQTLLLLAGGMMAFASCNNSANNQNPSQAQIDSMVNVKTGEIQATMQAQNDSTINAIAKAKADSELAAQKQSAPKQQVVKEVVVKEVHDGGRDHGHHGDHGDRNHYDQGNDQNYNNNDRSVTDRPGATNVNRGNGYNQPISKPVTDRPGATNTTR